MSVSIPDVDTDAPDLSEADRLIRRFIEGKREDTDTPHRDPDVLMHYYWDREWSQKDVADELGCHHATVSQWLKKTEIGARTKSEANKGQGRVERASFVHADKGGHEIWTVRDPDMNRTVSVHRLLAVADGADPADVFGEDTHVHHRTCIPWFNLPGFVEVMTPGEHNRTHMEAEWTEDGGVPVLEAQD